MRSAIALSIVASAAAVSAATNCNPSYNVPTSGTCFTGCNVKAGQTYLSGWTMDSTSEKFIPSLKVMCTKGTSQYIAFMTTAGMCMVGCTDPQDLFNTEFAGACTWYAEHKDDTCAADAVTTTTAAAVATTTTAAAVVTTTTAAVVVDTTTTVAAVTDTTTTTVAADATSATMSTVPSAAASVATGVSSAVSAASSGISAAVSSAAISASKPIASAAASSPAASAQSGATKMQIGGYAMALAACASYFAL